MTTCTDCGTTHDNHEKFHYECADCQAEMTASEAEHRASYRAERELRQSIALAREDLDMGLDVDEAELMAAIQARLK